MNTGLNQLATVRRRVFRRLRVAAKINAINLRGQADFRADFIASILDGVLWQTSVVVFASVLLVRFDSIGDWSSQQVLLLASMRLTSHGLVSLFFGRILYINSIIAEGRIDTYLIRPLAVHRQIQYSKFSANAFGDLLVGLSMLVVSISVFDLRWTVTRVVLLGGGLLGGTLMEAAINNILAGLTLRHQWAASWSFRFQEIISTVGSYPLSILPTVAQFALTFLLPIAFIAYLPAAAITGHISGAGVPALLAYGAPAVGITVWLISRWLWRICLDNYQGANS